MATAHALARHGDTGDVLRRLFSATTADGHFFIAAQCIFPFQVLRLDQAGEPGIVSGIEKFQVESLIAAMP
jgi:hypothetical protein